MRNSSRNDRARVGAAAALALTSGLVAVGAAVGADWPQLRGDAQRSGVSPEAIKPPLSVLWRFTGGAQGNNLTTPIVIGNTVYYTTRVSAQQGGVLYALDIQTGARKWAFPKEERNGLSPGLPGGNYFSTSITYSQGKLYVGTSNGTLYILDAKTGTESGGPFSLGQRLESSPLIQDDTVYMGSNNGTFYALDTQTGEKRWSRLDVRNRRTVGYSYSAGEAITSAPLSVGDMLLFTTSDNQIHGIKQATGNFRWKTRLPYTFLPNGLAFAGNSLFLATGPAVYSVLPTSGSIRWYRNLPNDILAAPAVSDGIVYVGCKRPNGADGGLLYALKDNGREQWKEPAKLPFPPAGAPVVSGDIIYLPGTRGTIMAINKEDGTLLWDYRLVPSVNRSNTPTGTETAIAAPLAVSGGTLFALSADGTLTAFRSDAPDTTGPVFTEHYPKAGSALNGKAPFVVAAKVGDAGSGLNVDSISGQLDGKDVDVVYDEKRNLVYYVTQATGGIVDRPLADGRHTVSLRAKDWKGNETEETWSFVIDNALPPRAGAAAPNVPTKPSGPATPGSGNTGGRGPGGSGRGNGPGGRGPGGRG